MSNAPPRAGFLPLPMLVLLLLLATTPFWLARVGLYQYLALEVMVWMLFALGYNLMLGTTGLPSFGHGAFFGVGAYAFGLLQQRVWANLWFDLAGAIVVAAALGALVGACIAHKRGIYFALLTIAFGQVFWFVAVKWHSVTGGEDGLQNIARPLLPLGFASVDLRSNEALFYFCFVLFAIALVVLWRLVHSPFGRVLAAIRQNEMRAAFVGYDVWLYKWLVITIASTFAGLAGRDVRAGAAIGLPERDEPALVGLRRDDGADRRRPGQLLGAGDRRAVLHPRARRARRLHRDLAALVRPVVHRHGAVAARGHRRAWQAGARWRATRAAPRALPAPDGASLRPPGKEALHGPL